MRKINVLYVSNYDHLRMGGQRSMMTLIEHLDRDLVIPHVLAPKEAELSAKARELGCKVHILPKHGIKPKNFVKIRKRAYKIKDLCDENDIDIMHMDHDRDLITCGFIKNKTKAKIVWHIRVAGARPMDFINRKIPHAFIGISRDTAKRLTDREMDYFKVIYNGVDTALFKPAEDKKELRKKLNLPINNFILLFAGQIKIEKGIIDIAKALGKMKSQDKKTPFVLFVGKPRNEEHINLLNDKISEHGLNDRVKILPQQNNIHEWMQAADALALPSHDGAEGMGRVLQEAMACGIAAIGSDTMGVREAIEDNSGILVPEKNPSELANALIKLMEDNQYYRRIADAGYNRAMKLYDVRVHAQNIMDYYQEILGTDGK